METLSRDELVTMSTALDSLVRNEGNALAQVGIAGIRGKGDLLTSRIALALQVDAKIRAEIDAIDAAAKKLNESGGG